MKKLILLISATLLFAAQIENAAAFTEPKMSDYSAFPISTAQSVKPNIMIMLDNSMSMNSNAYGPWPGEDNLVTDDHFNGEPYSGAISIQVMSSFDDVEEDPATNSTLTYTSPDMDVGSGGSYHLGGIRFQDVAIPKGATIVRAYLEFNARNNRSGSFEILIQGESSGDAQPFDDEVVDDLKNRTATSASVSWSSGSNWSSGNYYESDDITPIVQEIVDNSGWDSGNSMVFRLEGVSGYRDIETIDGNSDEAPKLHIFIEESVKTRYYGYFSPDHFYTYGSNIFELAYKKVEYNTNTQEWDVENLDGTTTSLSSAQIVSGKLWDGNWLNWLCMRRVDVLRKVLMGGLATGRTGGGNQTNIGASPNSDYIKVYRKKFDSTATSAVSPYHAQATNFQIKDGYFYVDTDHNGSFDTNYTIVIDKEIDHEPDDFYNGKLAGVLQRVGDKARWGNSWFNKGYGNNGDGGKIAATIDTNMTTLITDLQNEKMLTWTPLAESFYVVMQYFKQDDVDNVGSYPNGAVPNANDGDDPYLFGGLEVPCAKSFVLLLTDGASTKDANIPSTYKDYDGDNKEPGSCTDSSCLYDSGGSDYLDDLTLYARTKDLRPDGDSDGLDGDQNLIFYTVHAFDKSPDASNLLRDAARNGGFDDRNGDGKPNGGYNSPPEDRLEWDKDGDGEPDTFFEASDGYEIESELLAAITDILKRASSGTTASVLATNNLGAGNSLQSYYRPMVTDGLEEVRWTGYLHSLWVDPWGNLREDSNPNLALDLRSAGDQSTADTNVDKIVEMVNNGADTILRRYTKHYLYNHKNGSSGECTLTGADCNLAWDDLPLDSMAPIFEAGDRLSQRLTSTRKIFTYLGKSGTVTDTDESFDTSEDVVYFDDSMKSRIKPFLGVSSDAAWGDSGMRLGADADTRVANIIDWVRGTDITGLRNRTLKGITWPLGDIVHSTPLMVGRASEYYHLLYGDEDYINFINYAKDRETVIYVGANDGMMHAFTNYVLKKKEKSVDPNEMPYYESYSSSTELIGDELWAYIPQSVLPHLKWTASEDYTHTYYVNGEPRVFDAKILDDDMHYWDSDSNPNYGTFMVFGLNMGGKDISVNEDFGNSDEVVDFSPTYVMMDITDPRKPRVMWERSYEGMGMSTSVPAPVRVGSLDGNNGDWFLVFGSGVTDYEHGSADLEDGLIFVVDLETGDPIKSTSASAGEEYLFKSTRDSYFNSPLAVDSFRSNDVDAIYIAENYYSSNTWKSDVHKITIPCSKCPWEMDDGSPKYTRVEYDYNEDPTTWRRDTLFEAEGPVTAKILSARDPLRNRLLFFGTGRYHNQDDAADMNNQYLYSVKDPFYNVKYDLSGGHFHNEGNPLTLTHADLLDSTGITVNTDGTVSGYTGTTDFWDFVDDVRENEDGWRVDLATDASAPSERIITQTAVYGGLFITPTFSPSSEICAMGGQTTFLAGYYETGTGYFRSVFDVPATETQVSIRSPNSYTGMPPSKLVLHDGQERGANINIQLGTGALESAPATTVISNEDAIMERSDDQTMAPPGNPACDYNDSGETPITFPPSSPSGP